MPEKVKYIVFGNYICEYLIFLKFMVSIIKLHVANFHMFDGVFEDCVSPVVSF